VVISFRLTRYSRTILARRGTDLRVTTWSVSGYGDSAWSLACSRTNVISTTALRDACISD